MGKIKKISVQYVAIDIHKNMSVPARTPNQISILLETNIASNIFDRLNNITIHSATLSGLLYALYIEMGVLYHDFGLLLGSPYNSKEIFEKESTLILKVLFMTDCKVTLKMFTGEFL